MPKIKTFFFYFSKTDLEGGNGSTVSLQHSHGGTGTKAPNTYDFVTTPCSN